MIRRRLPYPRVHFDNLLIILTTCYSVQCVKKYFCVCASSFERAVLSSSTHTYTITTNPHIQCINGRATYKQSLSLSLSFSLSSLLSLSLFPSFSLSLSLSQLCQATHTLRVNLLMSCSRQIRDFFSCLISLMLACLQVSSILTTASYELSIIAS